jgi:hypothetical protein
MKNRIPSSEPIAGNSSRSLWIGVGLLFGLLAVAWAALFTAASRNPVQTVPLEHVAKP